MVCSKCNFEIKDTDNHCRQCGEETGREYFECECGAEVESQDNYCHACGTKFEGVEEVDDSEEEDSSDAPETEEENL